MYKNSFIINNFVNIVQSKVLPKYDENIIDTRKIVPTKNYFKQYCFYSLLRLSLNNEFFKINILLTKSIGYYCRN